MAKYHKQILALMTEPRTPNEIASLLKATQFTIQQEMIDMALAGELNQKKVARVRIFWRKEGSTT